MRDYLVFYVNGKEHRVGGDQAFLPLSTYLRYHHSATGTKVVCEEGDCGACSVIVGRLLDGEIVYRALNSCIQFLYQLDCTHIVTVEGLKYDDELNPVQEAMVACHGAQCGYCTPGFIVAMCAMFDKQKPTCSQDVKDGLTGNLCRCTGYEPIIKAALAVDADRLTSLHRLYPSDELLQCFQQHASIPVSIETAEHKFYNPVDIKEACRFKGEEKGTVVVAGGTDVSVYWNKRNIKPRRLLSVSRLPGMREISIQDGKLIVGAKATLAELEDFVGEHLPELHRILWLFGSPQIRNAGTLAGNIANGSPIADSLPFLHVMEAELELTGAKGTRAVNINSFFTGYKQMDLADDELITRIVIPLPAPEETVRLYKVSKRQHLDISAFTAAFRLRIVGGHIAEISIAYGGVAPVIKRLRRTEDFLRGKTFSLEHLTAAGDVALSEITPISDVRGSSDFRNTLAANVLQKLWYELQQPGVHA